MTIKVGDQVQISYDDGHSWGSTPHTVLAIQDCDYNYPSEKRKWAVVAFKSDRPSVHYLKDVRKLPVIEVVTIDMAMSQEGGLYFVENLFSTDTTPVKVSFTKVDGVISLDHPYTVTKRD
jgi:hypothetical protein